MSAFPITIFHNPACGTSRNVLAMIRAAGHEPTIVEYLKTGWTRDQLKELLAAMGARPRDVLRSNEKAASDIGSAAGDDEVIAAMVAQPVLVNRPIVVTPKGVKLCRPSEVVFALLDRAPENFTKEDGQTVAPKHAG